MGRKTVAYLLFSVLPVVAYAQQRSGGDFLLQESQKAGRSIFTWAVSIFFNLPVLLLIGIIAFSGYSFYRAYREAKENRDENAVSAGVKAGVMTLVFGGIALGAFMFTMDLIFGSQYISTLMTIFRTVGNNLAGQ